jgi:hypothetical protein
MSLGDARWLAVGDDKWISREIVLDQVLADADLVEFSVARIAACASRIRTTAVSVVGTLVFTPVISDAEPCA